MITKKEYLKKVEWAIGKRLKLLDRKEPAWRLNSKNYWSLSHRAERYVVKHGEVFNRKEFNARLPNDIIEPDA